MDVGERTIEKLSVSGDPGRTINIHGNGTLEVAQTRVSMPADRRRITGRCRKR